MELTEVNKILNEFVNKVIKDAKANLKSNDSNASGDLSKSLKGEINVGKNSIDTTIQAEDYWKFIDYGVKGVKGGRSLNGFAYKNKKPPVRFLQTWIKQKTGVFRQRNLRSQAFAVQNAVFNYGIKPTSFLTNPFESAFRSLPDQLIEAYDLDLEDFINFTLKTGKYAV